MPCYDSRNDPEYIREEYLTKIDDLRYQNDKLTQYLCGLCSHAYPGHIDAVPGLRAWWKSHQEFDRKRKAR